VFFLKIAGKYASEERKIFVLTLFPHTFAAEYRMMEGNGIRSLLCLTDMNTDQQIARLESLVNGLLEHGEGYFLVEIRIKPTNNIKVYLDGDSGVSIEKCVSVNRKLYKLLEENEIYPNGDFSLEVSSPGLEEPLLLHRQYVKNINRNVEVTRKDGIKTEGILKTVAEGHIIVEETTGKNKKKETVEHTIPFDTIKTTKVQVVF
jgi:ribosome maturation factor RimP